MRQTFTGEVKPQEGGHMVHLSDRMGWASAVKSCSGKAVQITLEDMQPERSVELNSYYWGIVLGILSKELQIDKDDLHDFCKAKFLKQNMKKVNSRANGQEMIIFGIGSTAKLSNNGFLDYLSKIRAWSSADLGIFIPLPNEGPPLDII